MVDQAQVDQAHVGQLPGHRQKLRFNAVNCACSVEHAVRRNPDADLFCADRIDARLRDLQREAIASVCAAAVGVGALVDVGVEKLLHQITIGRMQFNAVESGLDGQIGRSYDRRAETACFWPL